MTTMNDGRITTEVVKTKLQQILDEIHQLAIYAEERKLDVLQATLNDVSYILLREETLL